MDAVLNWLFQGGVVAAAAFVMLLALERAPANARYVVCWAALFAIVALPALPSIQLTTASTEISHAPHADALVSLPDTWWTSTVVLLAAWIVWATVHILRFITAVAAIRRARTRSLLFPSNKESDLLHWVRQRAARRRATLVVSKAVSSAAVLGWGAPMIAVSPSLLEALGADELDRVVIHEWAHVQRRDDLFNILQIAVRMIVGWHPAVWWIDRRLHVEREMACDEMTVGITGSPKTYAECLMKIAGLGRTSRTLLTSPAVLTSSGLRARVIKIVSTQPSIAPRWSRSVGAAIVTVLCVLSVALAGLKLVDATVLALPIVSPRALTTASHRTTPTAVPPSDIKTDRSVRMVARLALSQHPQPETPSQQPAIETPPLVTPDASPAPDSPPPPTVSPEVADTPVLATVPQIAPEPSGTTAERPRAPWTVAADGGVAIGRKSRDAGVATAGFFTRFGRRVAGSF